MSRGAQRSLHSVLDRIITYDRHRDLRHSFGGFRVMAPDRGDLRPEDDVNCSFNAPLMHVRWNAVIDHGLKWGQGARVFEQAGGIPPVLIGDGENLTALFAQYGVIEWQPDYDKKSD